MRPIKRSTKDPEAKFRLNIMLTERTGAQLRKKSRETVLSQSRIVETALKEYFSPAREDERMEIVNERLQSVRKEIEAMTGLLPSVLKAELAGNFTKLDRNNRNEQYLQEVITDLRNQLASSEKLRNLAHAEAQKKFRDLQKEWLEYKGRYESANEMVSKLQSDLRKANDLAAFWHKCFEEERNTFGGWLNKFFYGEWQTPKH